MEKIVDDGGVILIYFSLERQIKLYEYDNVSTTHGHHLEIEHSSSIRNDMKIIYRLKYTIKYDFLPPKQISC